MTTHAPLPSGCSCSTTGGPMTCPLHNPFKPRPPRAQSYESYLETECRRLREALDIAWAWMGVTVDSHNHERYLTALEKVTAIKGGQADG